MSNEVAKKQEQVVSMEKVLLQGDLSKLTPDERLRYYMQMCESVGLNPTTQPFEYITMNGKMVLYAKKSCTEQLRQIHKVSLHIMSREAIGDVYVVTARAKTAERDDESTGAVSIAGLRGDALANAYMKAETKAKRRVTLSICGLAMLDESEASTVPGARIEMPTLIPTSIKSKESKSSAVLKESEPVKPALPKSLEHFSASPAEKAIEMFPGAEVVRPDYTIKSGTLKGTKLSERPDAHWMQYVQDLGNKIQLGEIPRQHIPAAEELYTEIKRYLGE